MNETKLSDIAKKDHSSFVEIHKDFLSFTEKTITDFLTVKMAFLAFLGVVFSIAINDPGYSYFFKIVYVIIAILSFLLLLDDLWQKFKCHSNSINISKRDAILCNIRYSAAACAEKEKNLEVRLKFLKIGADAEQMINQENMIHTLVTQGQSAKEILEKVQRKGLWKLDFILWSFLFLSMPLLFLMELLRLL